MKIVFWSLKEVILLISLLLRSYCIHPPKKIFKRSRNRKFNIFIERKFIEIGYYYSFYGEWHGITSTVPLFLNPYLSLFHTDEHTFFNTRGNSRIFEYIWLWLLVRFLSLVWYWDWYRVERLGLLSLVWYWDWYRVERLGLLSLAWYWV